MAKARRKRKKNTKYCFICRKDLSISCYGFRFCSKKHYDEHTYKEYIKAWLNRDNPGGSLSRISKHVRKWIYKNRGRKCERCGWEEKNPISGHIPVEINHISGDRSDHSPENLEILCPNHHSMTPTYGSLNRGLSNESDNDT